MMEIWEEEGERNSEWSDGPGDEIGSDSVLECIRNFPMYSPPRSLTDWRANQVQSPPLDLFGLQFGYEAYLPPATTSVSNIEVSLGYEASLFGVQFEYESHLKEKSTTERPKRKYMTAYLITTTDDLRQLFGHKRKDAAKTKTLGGAKNIAQKVKSWKCRKELHRSIAFIEEKYTIETPKRKYRTKRLITLYDLRQVFGLKRVDAAKTLGVSVATFKPYRRRRRRRKGIKWWNGLVEPKLLNNSVHQNSSGSNPPEVPGEKEISTLSGARQDAVTVKAKYGEGCWIGAEMNHIVQFLKVKESNAQGYSLEGRCVKANNVMDEKLNSGVQYNQTFERRPGVETIQLDSSEERIFGELGAKNIGQKVGSAEKSCIAISHSKKKNTIETPKRKYRTKRSITLDDLRPLFGQKRVDAAKTLGVSESTFKRHCRQNGITWWNGDGCPLVEPMLVNNSVQQNSSGSKPPEVQGEKEISALLGAGQDAVTIKAKYGEVNLKFELSTESSFAELQEAVAKRLKSKAFIVEYEDEDQEPILIACDEDWEACVKFFGNQAIRLSIRERISNSKKSNGSGRGLKRTRS